MKKILSCVLAASLLATATFAQVMDRNGLQNTLSTSFGQDLDTDYSNADRDPVRYHGFYDTFQIRYDVAKFTFEGMLNWGLIFDWYGGDSGSFKLENTGLNSYNYLHDFDGNWWTGGGLGESYYVNFAFHPFDGFDVGFGTRLNWKIGAAPSKGGEHWEPYVHSAQGGLLDGEPKDGGKDVVGFIYYPNYYTANYKSASGSSNASLGLRYRYSDFLEVGIALPSGDYSKAPTFNAAFNIHPVDVFKASIAYNGIGQSNSNLYIGTSLYFSNFNLDAYVAANFRAKEYNSAPSNNKWGFGAAALIGIPKTEITFKPELGFSFYADPNYTFAWNVGCRFDFPFANQFKLGTWLSFAGGAMDRRWSELPGKKNWDGGFIFNIRPDFSWDINSRHKIAVFAEYMNRKAYNGAVRDTWDMGFTWAYRY